MSRHASRQKRASELGATDIVTERGQEGVERVKELTGGPGAGTVLECVGSAESMRQMLHAARPAATPLRRRAARGLAPGAAAGRSAMTAPLGPKTVMPGGVRNECFSCCC